MSSSFSRSLSLLRKEKKISQRAAAHDLQISQALLSHYENGIREPGLAFVVRACDYYAVSADFLLGRTLSRDGVSITAQELEECGGGKDNVLRGSVMATLQKKLLVNTINVLFDMLGKLGNRKAIMAAACYIGTGLYKLFRHFYRAGGSASESFFFSVTATTFLNGGPESDLAISEVNYVTALGEQAKEKGSLPVLSHDMLSENYPGTYQSLLQVMHACGERMGALWKEG